MNQASSRLKAYQQPEWWLATLITLVLIWFHIHFWMHAGGLWRDEINSLNVARASDVSDWTKDSFPILMPALLHGWTMLGLGDTDSNLRLFGLLVGLAIPAALWFTSSKEKKIPVFGLTLFGLNSILIVFGDSIRAYGLGCLTIILAMAAALHFLRQPSVAKCIWLAIAYVAAVQTLYNNAILVGAICAGAIVVCLRRKTWIAAAQVFVAGAIAAISLLPYWNILNPANTSAVVLKTGLKRWRFVAGLTDTFGFPMPLYAYAWLIALLIIVVLAVIALRKEDELAEDQNTDADLQLFSGMTLICGATGFCLFLWLAAMPSQSWYWLPPMAVASVCLDLAWPKLRSLARVLFIGLIAATALIAFPADRQKLDFRFTNADIWARDLNTKAVKGDYIVVVPWFCGITFDHYFSGVAKWDTLPPLTDHKTHRYDLVKTQLQNTNAIVPVIDNISAALHAGHRVWLVAASGWMDVPEPNTTAPSTLPPAPLPSSGWSDMPYTLVWDSQVAHFVGDHSEQFQRVTNRAAEFFAAEKLDLYVASGWKDPNPRPQAQ